MPAYGNTLRTLAKFPLHKAVIPSCCTIEPISRLILARVNFFDVCTWNNIFTLSAGATVVFATIPATPPETNLTKDVVLLFWVLLFHGQGCFCYAMRFGPHTTPGTKQDGLDETGYDNKLLDYAIITVWK